MTTMFRIAWAINIMLALVAVYFFLVGIADGSVSSFNIVLWLAILGAMAVFVFGGRALFRRGRVGLALALDAVPALGGIVYALFMLAVITSGARWN